MCPRRHLCDTCQCAKACEASRRKRLDLTHAKAFCESRSKDNVGFKLWLWSCSSTGAMCLSSNVASKIFEWFTRYMPSQNSRPYLTNFPVIILLPPHLSLNPHLPFFPFAETWNLSLAIQEPHETSSRRQKYFAQRYKANLCTNPSLAQPLAKPSY